MSPDPQRMEKIVSLCKRRGFIFQSSEIYGGLNGCWDYGPLGVELKRNLKDYWWRVMVRERDDIVGMDGAILTHRDVLKASGHLEGFSDPMSTCKFCKKLIRFDQLKEMVANSVWAQEIAEMIPPGGGAIHTSALLTWARGKGTRRAPNLALVRNPDVTLSWLA